MTSDLRQNTSNMPNSWLRSFVPGNPSADSRAGKVVSQPLGQIPPMPDYQGNTYSSNSPRPPAQLPHQAKAKVKMAATPGLSFQSINNYIRMSYVFVAVLVFAVGGWAFLFQIQGAVVAQGTIGVEGKPKTVQHLDGGVISEILVKDGDLIEQGQALLKLDHTVLDANRAAAQTNFYENEALISRLLSERSGDGQIRWSSALIKNKSESRAINAMRGQRQLFEARQYAFNGEINRLQLHINQLQEEVTGIESEIDHTIFEFDIVNQDLEKLRNLLQQSLVARDRVTSRELDKTRLTNEISKLKFRRESSILSIGESQAEINQLYNTRKEDILVALRTAQTQADSFNEDLQTASSKTEHIIIKAPVSGVVHNMEVTTIGGVIISGQELMQIVPVNDELVLQAQLQPQDIDQVSIGQDTKVIFSALNQKSPPELKGTVQYISADSLIDPVTGMPYFAVKIRIAESERTKLNGQKLIPGMPADIFIQTESRSVMNYLIAPLRKALNKTMREA